MLNEKITFFIKTVIARAVCGKQQAGRVFLCKTTNGSYILHNSITFRASFMHRYETTTYRFASDFQMIKVFF